MKRGQFCAHKKFLVPSPCLTSTGSSVYYKLSKSMMYVATVRRIDTAFFYRLSDAVFYYSSSCQLPPIATCTPLVSRMTESPKQARIVYINNDMCLTKKIHMGAPPQLTSNSETLPLRLGHPKTWNCSDRNKTLASQRRVVDGRTTMACNAFVCLPPAPYT